MSGKLLKRMMPVGLVTCFLIIFVSSKIKAGETAEDYNQLGIECFKAGDYDCAYEHFTEAIELDPSFSRAYLNRAATIYEKNTSPLLLKNENQLDSNEQSNEPALDHEEAGGNADDEMSRDCFYMCEALEPYTAYYKNGEFEGYCQPDYFSFDLRPVEETERWKDLLEKSNSITPGMTQAQVTEIMGEPDKNDEFDFFEKSGLTPSQIAEIIGEPDENNEFENNSLYEYKIKRHFELFELYCGITNRDSSIRIEFENDGVVSVHQDPNYRIAFDAEDWATASDWRRRAMIDDFIKNYHPENMNKDELIAVLGTPREDRMFESYDLVYDLGPMWVTLFPVDNDWFVVNFSEDGRVTEFGIISD